MERKLRYFTTEIGKFNIECDSAGKVNDFLEDKPQISSTSTEATSGKVLEALEAELEGYETQLKELNDYSEKLTVEYNEKVELQEVLEKALSKLLKDKRKFKLD